jgi:hypothetical protein
VPERLGVYRVELRRGVEGAVLAAAEVEVEAAE